jgi:hypothetical protein
MPIPSNSPIEEDLLILGEGDSDSAFFKNLCEKRNIAGFQCENVGGKQKFQSYLEALEGRTGFDRLKAILLVADSDDDPDERFDSVRKQIKKAKNFPHPDNPLTLAKRSGCCSTAIMMIPFGAYGPTRGCLETILYPAACTALRHLVACVDDFCRCTGADRWGSRTSVDKLKLRALLSVAWSDDPNLNLPNLVSLAKGLIPLENNVFDPIADYLNRFKGLD